MQNRTRQKRLRMLLEMLENHDKIFKKRNVVFNMNSWCEKLDCGTAACALGSAAMYPPFVKMGWKLRSVWIGKKPIYKGYEFLEAAEVFFGISGPEASDLFFPSKYSQKNIKPKHVAKKVSKLLIKYFVKSQKEKRHA